MTNEKITIKNEIDHVAQYIANITKTSTKKHILRDIEIALIKEQLEQNAIKITDKKGNLCCSREAFMAFLGNILNNDQGF